MSRPSWFRSGWTSAGSLAWCVIALSCATPPPSIVTPPPPPAVARLLVENLTDYEWDVAVAATAGTEVCSARVPARGSIALNLAGGDYVIEQTARLERARPALVRKAPARLEPGQTYRWRLATLLSSPAGGARP
jgi:hypothetical protein